jgi:hypothetical protein
MNFIFKLRMVAECSGQHATTRRVSQKDAIFQGVGSCSKILIFATAMAVLLNEKKHPFKGNKTERSGEDES